MDILIDEHEIEEKDKGFFEKMKFQIMQNLQITLTNFHLCYETNSTTKLGHPFSFGITIHSLQLIVISFVFHYQITTSSLDFEKHTKNGKKQRKFFSDHRGLFFFQ